MPDVLFYFGVDVVPSSTTLSPSQVASYSGFLSSAAASFSSLLSVSPSLLYAVNVTDRATGAAVQVGVVRRLAGGGLGSAGVTVTFVIRLGKTPEQIRTKYKIRNDFTAEEEKAVEEEQKWAEEE